MYYNSAMMNSKVFEVIKQRTSLRDYADKPIEQEKLDLILEAARLAPSASNSQPWHFYVVRDKSKIKAISERMPLRSERIINSFIADAPVVIAATAGPIDLLHKITSFIVNKRWYYMDVAIALEHMVLTAQELGIGSCWIGWFSEKRVREILEIPKDQEVIALLTLGYPKEGHIPYHKGRKSKGEIMKFL